MTPAEKVAAVPTTGAPSSVDPAAEAGPFVINLCSSSTPMALPQADLPELKRFTFFISRRFEEGRERFRLHMGFFATQAEAESWLGLVREVYPGAWAGEAPGKKLRARAVAAAEAQAAHAAGPHAVAPQVEPPTPPRNSTQPVKELPTLQPAPAVPARAPRVRSSSGNPRRSPAKSAPSRPAAFADSNIKEVLAALDAPQCGSGQDAVAPALTDTQALQCLEGKATESAKPAAFAVQLRWSVQPITFDKLPPLAIFSAYTLYCVEGSREGRKWYGLRLGFFNDPISAKQVAAYVRSEFASAAVVPVSADERHRVGGESGAVALRPTRKTSKPADQEFKLFDADSDGAAPGAAAPVHASPSAAPVKPKASVSELRPGSSPKRSAALSGVDARERRAPQTLEETLEILGANELTIDDGRETNGSGHSGSAARKSERSSLPFTRLLERLGERVRKG